MPPFITSLGLEFREILSYQMRISYQEQTLHGSGLYNQWLRLCCVLIRHTFRKNHFICIDFPSYRIWMPMSHQQHTLQFSGLYDQQLTRLVDPSAIQDKAFYMCRLSPPLEVEFRINLSF